MLEILCTQKTHSNSEELLKQAIQIDSKTAILQKWKQLYLSLQSWHSRFFYDLWISCPWNKMSWKGRSLLRQSLLRQSLLRYHNQQKHKISNIIINWRIKLGLVADPVIEANARLEFEDGMRTGVLPGGCWYPCSVRT